MSYCVFDHIDILFLRRFPLKREFCSSNFSSWILIIFKTYFVIFLNCFVLYFTDEKLILMMISFLNRWGNIFPLTFILFGNYLQLNIPSWPTTLIIISVILSNTTDTYTLLMLLHVDIIISDQSPDGQVLRHFAVHRPVRLTQLLLIHDPHVNSIHKKWVPDRVQFHSPLCTTCTMNQCNEYLWFRFNKDTRDSFLKTTKHDTYKSAYAKNTFVTIVWSPWRSKCNSHFFLIRSRGWSIIIITVVTIYMNWNERRGNE